MHPTDHGSSNLRQNLPHQPRPAIDETAVNLNQRGVLLFAPVGAWCQTVKICPPLTVTEEALLEACDVLDTAVDDAVAGK